MGNEMNWEQARDAMLNDGKVMVACADGAKFRARDGDVERLSTVTGDWRSCCVFGSQMRGMWVEVEHE